MTRLRAWWRRFWADPGDYVSQATVTHHLKAQWQDELPHFTRWHTPKEVAKIRFVAAMREARQMRLAERRRA